MLRIFNFCILLLAKLRKFTIARTATPFNVKSMCNTLEQIYARRDWPVFNPRQTGCSYSTVQVSIGEYHTHILIQVDTPYIYSQYQLQPVLIHHARSYRFEWKYQYLSLTTLVILNTWASSLNKEAKEMEPIRRTEISEVTLKFAPL